MTAIGDATRRGYTEHSMLDNIGLIHMNGRVFDPLIGRFTSPDPIVSCLLTTQAWNRYSYVKNRPMMFTDPSGFIPEITVWGTAAFADDYEDFGGSFNLGGLSGGLFNAGNWSLPAQGRRIDEGPMDEVVVSGSRGDDERITLVSELVASDPFQLGRYGQISPQPVAEVMEEVVVQAERPKESGLDRGCYSNCMRPFNLGGGLLGGAIAGSAGGLAGAFVGAAVGLVGGIAEQASVHADSLGDPISSAAGNAAAAIGAGAAAGVGAAINGASAGQAGAIGAAGALSSGAGVGVEAAIAAGSSRGLGGLTALTPGARQAVTALARGGTIGGLGVAGMLVSGRIQEWGGNIVVRNAPNSRMLFSTVKFSI
jgi:RHS repeat-associated protein